MLVLQTIRLGAYGRFQYRIDTDDQRTFITGSAEEAAETLRQLGVKEPERLIQHAETWGSVEIANIPTD